MTRYKYCIEMYNAKNRDINLINKYNNYIIH